MAQVLQCVQQINTLEQNKSNTNILLCNLRTDTRPHIQQKDLMSPSWYGSS